MKGSMILSFNNGRLGKPVEYTPGYQKPDGKKVPPKAHLFVVVNKADFTNSAGIKMEGGSVAAGVDVWGETADNAAKWCGKGKQISGLANVSMNEYPLLDPHTKRPVMDSTGKEIIKKDFSFNIIPNSLDFGNDSQELIEKEQQTGKGLHGMLAWNGYVSVKAVAAAHANKCMDSFLAIAQQGPEMHAKAIAERKALKYQEGMEVFGEAIVKKAKGAVDQGAYALPAAVAQAIAATPGLGGSGLTYELMKAKGWTDAQMLTEEGGKYAYLVPNVPAPPTTATSAV